MPPTKETGPPLTGILAGAVTALALALTGACGDGRDFKLDVGRSGPPVTRPQLWTLFDIQKALREGGRVGGSDSFPDGLDPKIFINGTPAAQTLTVNPAFCEGDAAAYVSAEAWVNVDEIWVQPWYVLLTAWNDKTPSNNRLKDAMGNNAPPIWDVGPKSLFYSPFWKYIYVVVPPGTTVDTYHSSEGLFNDHLEMHEFGGWTFSVRPPEVTGDQNGLVHPIVGTPIGNLSTGAVSWADKESYAYFNQGSNNFRWNDRLVVEEVPLYILAKRNGAGRAAPLGVPNVMGSGPPFARRPADAPGGRPRFGAYSRLYFAYVGANAAPFDAAQFPAAAQALMDKNVDPKLYQGRVANNGAGDTSCFKAMTFPMGCQWLDSQARIEDTLGPTAIERTDTAVSSALVFYAGKGIGR